MHQGLGLQGTPPRPPPSRKKGPAQSNPLEKFISESRLETSGALMRVSPRTQPPASDPGRLQVLGHSDQEDFLLSNQSLHPIFPGLGALLAEGEHLGVSTTPPPTPSMKTLKKQWLEVLSTYQYVLCFCFLGLFFSLVGFLLLFTSLWYLPVLYLVWLFLDWDTPQQGGRRYQWLKNWTAWKHLSDYFSIKLVKTAELPPDRNYVLASHPHGVIAVGTVCNFATEGTGLSQLFPGLRFSLAVLHCLLYLPGHREYFLSCGACSVNRQSLDYVLSQSQLGRAVVIVVGGANEALYAFPGEHCLTLRNRKGFVRLALRHGASLVPVYSFGENDIFRTKAFALDSWQHRLQVTMKKLLSFSPCIFWGRGLFSAKSWGLLPFARPITTVVGRAIPVPQCPQPTEEQVDHYHSLYMKALEQLFEEHKESCGIPASTHLTFI